MKKTEDFYRIGDMVKLYGFGQDSLRYYERKGILTPVRGENGYRLYKKSELWRMNIVANLRQLSFPVERIRRYFQERSVAATMELLREELDAAEEGIRALESMRRELLAQIETVEHAAARETDRVTELELPPRRVFEIDRSYSSDAEFDLLMKDLVEINGHKLYLIGNNRVGSVVTMERIARGEFSRYDSAFIIDGEGDGELPGGRYLSVVYNGAADNRRYSALLLDYAAQRGLKLADRFYELVWIDIHTTERVEEYVTELQIRVI